MVDVPTFPKTHEVGYPRRDPIETIIDEFRPYTAESVVSKRGLMKVEYASDQQAKKLFALLEQHAKVPFCVR